MTRTRLGSLLVGLVGLLLLAMPAAAQPSTTAGLINDLNGRLLYVAIPITILVEAILIYTVLKFKDSDEPSPTRENRRLEITWTVATAIVLLFVGAASYGVLASPDVTYTGGEIDAAEGDVHVETVAYQWNWRMNYQTSDISELTASDIDTSVVPAAEGLEGPVIVVPEGQDLYFTSTSEDVIHGFSVPALGLKQDAIPGQENTLKTVAQETGVYQGYCTEYCGVAHSKMYFSVIVVDQDTYDQFVDNQTSGDSGTSNASSSLATPTGLGA